MAFNFRGPTFRCWMCFGFLFLVVSSALPAHAESVRTTTVGVDVVYAEETKPTWRLEADRDALKRVGLLREGDRVIVRLIPGPAEMTVLATSVEQYRYASGRKCSGFWLFRKCTVIRETTPCNTELKDHPTMTGNVETTVTFLREGVGGPASVGEKVVFGSVTGYADKEVLPMGPRSIEISGMFSKEIEKCREPPPDSELVSGPELKNPFGKTPKRWFSMTITVHPPKLDS